MFTATHITGRRRAQSALRIGLLVIAGCAGVAPAGADEPAADAKDGMQYPLAVAVTADGVIYVADRNLPGIWKLQDGKRELYFQGSKRFRTPLNAVRCLAIDADGRLLAGDSATREVYRFNDQAQPEPLTKGGIGIPMSIAVHDDGSLFVADLETHRIWKVAAAGGQPEEVITVSAPRGLAFDGQKRLWILSTSSKKGQLLRLDGETLVAVVAERRFRFPHQVVIVGEHAFVTDGYGKAVWKVAADGEPTALVQGEPLVNPVGLAAREETLYVVDPRANGVFTIPAAGGELQAVPAAAN